MASSLHHPSNLHNGVISLLNLTGINVLNCYTNATFPWLRTRLSWSREAKILNYQEQEKLQELKPLAARAGPLLQEDRNALAPKKGPGIITRLVALPHASQIPRVSLVSEVPSKASQLSMQELILRHLCTSKECGQNLYMTQLPVIKKWSKVLCLTNAAIAIQGECSSLDKETCFTAEAFKDKKHAHDHSATPFICQETLANQPLSESNTTRFMTAALFCFSQMPTLTTTDFLLVPQEHLIL